MMLSKPLLSKSALLPLMLLGLTLLLSGCLGPKTPQAVTLAFWQAVVENHADAVAKYSTLADPKAFAGFGLQWGGFKPELGKIVIEGDQATVETRFAAPAGSDKASRHYTTYLVRKAGVWKVDFKTTAQGVHGGALGVLFGRLNQLGGELSKSLDASARSLNVELERLSQKLKTMSDSFSQQASGIIDKHAQQLQGILRELEDSIHRALEDGDNHPSDKDKQVMVKVSTDLTHSCKALADPTTQSITICNADMATARQQLETVDDGVSANYKQHWQTLSQRFDAVMREMVDELSRSVKQS